MNTFETTSYKVALRTRLEQLKNHNRHYNFQNMAKHCRIQKTYLSRVLNRDDAHLTADQLYLALEFLGFAGKEREYVEKCYEFERSQLQKRREELKAELQLLREKNLKTESHISAATAHLTQEDWNRYYLNPDVQLIHMFLTVPAFAKAPKSIQNSLGIDDETFMKAINTLLRLQVISANKDGYQVLQNKLHLPADASIAAPYKQILRMRSAERIRSLDSKTSYNFSVIFTASPSERRAIQEAFLKFLKKAEKLVGNATPNAVYQMNFDLFDWSN